MNVLETTRTEVPAGNELRCRLARAATSLFAQRGYSGVSVREICEIAGATKPMLYYYFGSKAALFRELVALSFEHFHAILLEAEADKRPVAQLLGDLAGSQLEWVTRAPEHARMVYAAILGPPEAAPTRELNGYRERNFALLTRVLAAAQARGELGPGRPEDLAFAFMGTLVMACLRVMEAVPDPLDPPARARELTRIFLEGGRPPEESR